MPRRDRHLERRRAVHVQQVVSAAAVDRAVRAADSGISRSGPRRGCSKPTDGEIVDLARIRDYIAELHQRFQVRGVVVEMFAAGNLPSDLPRLGIPVEVAQKTRRRSRHRRWTWRRACVTDCSAMTGIARDVDAHQCVRRAAAGWHPAAEKGKREVATQDRHRRATLLAMIPMLTQRNPLSRRFTFWSCTL